MGTGKRPTPRHKGDERLDFGIPDEEESETPLTVAELVSELLYAGKTRAEIAGYDDIFMRWVLCRKRDENGSLIRVPDDLPNWVGDHLDSRGHWMIRNPRGFGEMFRQVKRQQGLEPETAWKQWRAENPKYGEYE